MTNAIIGADFLEHYGFYVDIKIKKLSDSRTSLSVEGRLKCAHEPGIHAKARVQNINYRSTRKSPGLHIAVILIKIALVKM